MSRLVEEKTRTDLVNRLKRAEGQLRGLQRMITDGEPCLEIAGQMSAVRKALDSAYVRMTVCFLEQELQSHLHARARADADGELASMLADMQELLGKIR